MSKEYKGFNTFKDIEDERIRAWNRNAITLSVTRKGGLKLVTNYLKQFSNPDLKAILTIRKDIKQQGYAAVQREIKRSLR